jgi:hypothetical protein
MVTTDRGAGNMSLTAEEAILVDALVKLGRAQVAAAELFRDDVGLQAALDQLGATLKRWDSLMERVRLEQSSILPVQPGVSRLHGREFTE